MSNLIKHAEEELRRAKLFDKDSDYGGMIAESVMRLVRVFAAEGHSGMSAMLALHVFDKLMHYKTLTPLTDDPTEWMEVDTGQTWQSTRQSSCFSKDGGKTYYDIDGDDRTTKSTMDHRGRSE